NAAKRPSAIVTGSMPARARAPWAVWREHDLELRRPVAVEVLHPKCSAEVRMRSSARRWRWPRPSIRRPRPAPKSAPTPDPPAACAGARSSRRAALLAARQAPGGARRLAGAAVDRDPATVGFHDPRRERQAQAVAAGRAGAASVGAKEGLEDAGEIVRG